MADPLTDERLAELVRLAEGANPLPWATGGPYRDGLYSVGEASRDGGYVVDPHDPRVYEENAQYIVAACNAVPSLVDEVRRLRGVLRRVRDYDGPDPLMHDSPCLGHEACSPGCVMCAVDASLEMHDARRVVTATLRTDADSHKIDMPPSDVVMRAVLAHSDQLAAAADDGD